MADPRDYIVEVTGLSDDGLPQRSPAGGATGVSRGHAAGRSWLAVHWRCCHAYSRIYRNRDGTAYEGACPRCGRAARAGIGPDGTTARFFTAH